MRKSLCALPRCLLSAAGERDSDVCVGLRDAVFEVRTEWSLVNDEWSLRVVHGVQAENECKPVPVGSDSFPDLLEAA